MKRVAAIDCGTNSIRLLIAEKQAGEEGLNDLVRTMRIVRLGQGVDKTGRFDPLALQRTLAATDEYAALCRSHEVEATRFVATSATRDAANRDEFLTGVRERLGVEAEVISGNEEASLSFRGALSALAPTDAAPYLVVDIGGGSTELVCGGGTGVAASISMNIGSVRLTERHFRHDPPTAAEIDAARADIRLALDQAAQAIPITSVRTVVGVAGSVTTMSAFLLGLDAYQPDVTHGARFAVDEIVRGCEQMLTLPKQERAAFGFMHPGRVDVIGAGALIWSEVVTWAREQVEQSEQIQLGEVVTSEHDILDGIALSIS